MRIVLKEMQKILTAKNALILFVLTILIFVNLFSVSDSLIYYIRYGGNVYTGNYEIDLYKELISEVGPSLSHDEMDKIEEEQYKVLDAEVEKYEELKKAGITNYKELVENADIDDIKSPFVNGSELKVMCQQYYYEIGYYNYGSEGKASDESVKARILIEIIEELRENLSSDRREYSLLYPRSIDNTFEDLGIISMWITLCCMFIILPYQVREKHSRTTALKFATKVGRYFYIKQWLAVVGSSVIVALINLLLYAICFCAAGYTSFLPCSNATSNGLYWIEISFGTHLFIYALLIILFTAVAGTIFFLLSEASSHVEVLSLGIPCGLLIVAVDALLFVGLFATNPEALPNIKFAELWIIVGITLAVISIFSIFVRKNLHMDVEE